MNNTKWKPIAYYINIKNIPFKIEIDVTGGIWNLYTYLEHDGWSHIIGTSDIEAAKQYAQDYVETYQKFVRED